MKVCEKTSAEGWDAAMKKETTYYVTVWILKMIVSVLQCNPSKGQNSMLGMALGTRDSPATSPSLLQVKNRPPYFASSRLRSD
jgi:hypothetical protein